MKVLKYPTIDELQNDQRRLVANHYDDWNLVTGRVGKGKSTYALKSARKLDAKFTVKDRVFWDEEAFWQRYSTLEPGSCIILDEFNGNRRAAMHGERISFLERMKRTRSRRIHAWIIYDRVDSLDRQLLTDRNAYWHHLEYRGSVLVRQPDTKLVFKLDGTPIEPTKYPIVADFDFTAWLPPGWKEEYERLKDEAMDLFGSKEPRDAPKPTAQGVARVNMALVNLAQQELTR